MNYPYNAIIFVSLGVIVMLGLLAFGSFLTDVWFTTGVGLIVGFIFFVVSVKISKQSMLVMFVLLDDYKRKVLERLENEMDIDELFRAMKLQSNAEKVVLVRHVEYLKKRGFIKESTDFGKKKLKRNF